MTPAGAAVGGERRVFEGKVAETPARGSTYLMNDDDGRPADWKTVQSLFIGLAARRVRVTIEVLDDAAGESLPGVEARAR